MGYKMKVSTFLTVLTLFLKHGNSRGSYNSKRSTSNIIFPKDTIVPVIFPNSNDLQETDSSEIDLPIVKVEECSGCGLPIDISPIAPTEAVRSLPIGTRRTCPPILPCRTRSNPLRCCSITRRGHCNFDDCYR